MNRSRIPMTLAVVALALSLVALFLAFAKPAQADDAPPPAASATERPDYCPDAPAPCAGFEDEYADDNMPLEFDPDGRPVICPPYPAACAVPGYEDGPPYPQNHDVDGNPLPTGPATPEPAAEPSAFDPYELDPDGRPVGCPDAPAPCAYVEDDAPAPAPAEPTTKAPAPAEPTTKAPAKSKPTQGTNAVPGLPKAGV